MGCDLVQAQAKICEISSKMQTWWNPANETIGEWLEAQRTWLATQVVAGDDGSKWYTATDILGGDVGVIGDFALTPNGNVYEKTESGWVFTGVNIQGPTGASAYEIAVSNGFTGTEVEFANGLQNAIISELYTLEEKDKLAEIPNNIATLLSADDTTLDELQEIINFIKLNRAELNALTLDNIAETIEKKIMTAVERQKLTRLHDDYPYFTGNRFIMNEGIAGFVWDGGINHARLFYFSSINSPYEPNDTFKDIMKVTSESKLLDLRLNGLFYGDTPVVSDRKYIADGNINLSTSVDFEISYPEKTIVFSNITKGKKGEIYTRSLPGGGNVVSEWDGKVKWINPPTEATFADGMVQVYTYTVYDENTILVWYLNEFTPNVQGV